MDALPEVNATFTSIPGNQNLSSSHQLLSSMDDDISSLGSSLDSDEISGDGASTGQTAYEKQRATLQTYLNALPYECESVEEMQDKLEVIVGKILICAKTQNWLLLSTWDSILHCWLVMRYPMKTTTRVKLVKFYYQLCLMPGIEARLMRSWADMMIQLIGSRGVGKRKIEIDEMELSWKPLWNVLLKELWPKKKMRDDTRNVVNILMYLAEESKWYYPPTDIPTMLETFVPLITQDSVLHMVPVLTSFLPPTHIHLYMPMLFKLWEAFNSAHIDERLIDLSGLIAEEHVAGTSGSTGEEGSATYKDVGIWSASEWSFLMEKCLVSLNLPVGTNKGANPTASHADSGAGSDALRIKKTINTPNAFAKIIIYSMAPDGPVRLDASHNMTTTSGTDPGYLAGSKALDSLDRLITSTETFFHPSNVGPWSYTLTNFVHRLTSEFAKRWKEEELPTCKTPQERRLSPAIKRAFITTLRTPCLLAMFSKDPVSLAFAQGALRSMALLEPSLVMPQLLERTYSGLEVVNETHRTTAVLSMLSGLGLPLTSEKLWVGGQKHIVPLLELSIPGIDMNDPVKTICTTMFICAILQHIKIGDLSMQQSGVVLSGDVPPAELMQVDAFERLPSGVDDTVNMPELDKAEERAFTRDSTAAFADWIVSFFRRVFALYENLPEEGGKKNTTGGKSEEAILKSIKSTLDIVCMHLSDALFDLVLNLVYDYATTNARSNAVRAFGQLVACLARTKPERTIDRFLPFCVDQISDELRHGASSTLSTSSHEAAPSDTTLHWNLAILRGCLGYGGRSLLKHRAQILDLMGLLVDKTKSERGFSSTGRLINRVLNTLSGVYVVNSPFVNVDEWNTAAFQSDHNLEWGRLYTAEQVKLEWHTPSMDEITFVIDIIEHLAGPALDKVQSLIKLASWDAVARNDFCRYLNVARSVWSGLPTLLLEDVKNGGAPCLEEYEAAELLVRPLTVKAGFTLTPGDSRYVRVAALREKFGQVIHEAAVHLRQTKDSGEDHLDGVIMVARCIDVYLLEYGISRNGYTNLQKNYILSRDLNRIWSRQKENTRLVFVKRAQVYHSSRVYMHALYRRRSTLDDQLIADLTEWSVSPYTRIRKHAQAVLRSAFALYVRSTRLMLPTIFATLSRGTEPDRMKGALYVLSSKGTAAYAISDAVYMKRYLISILECQHQEKPSIQKLVSRMAGEAIACLGEDVLRIYSATAPPVATVMLDLESELSLSAQDHTLLQIARDLRAVRNIQREKTYHETIAAILEIAGAPGVHWRYQRIALQLLVHLLRRDQPQFPEVMKFFVDHTINPHPRLRSDALGGVLTSMVNVKARTYSRSEEEMWTDGWSHPSTKMFVVLNPSTCLSELQKPDNGIFVDKIPTGFVAWTSHIKGYASFPDKPVQWSPDCNNALQAAQGVLDDRSYFSTLFGLWAQESDREATKLDLRQDHISLVKSISKMYGARYRDVLLEEAEPLWKDADRFKQRAAVEILVGLIRGMKHWPVTDTKAVWNWLQARYDQIFNQIKPDTLGLWESWLGMTLMDRDPRRVRPLIDWALSLSLDFHGESAFTMTKTLSLFLMLVDSLYFRFPKTERYMNLFLDNAHTGFAEVRAQLASNLDTIMRCEWRPFHLTVQDFLAACNGGDALRIREAKYGPRLNAMVQSFPEWRQERLPPPRVNQSQYDKVGLTLLQWIWTVFHASHASTIFPYVMPLLPEILQMAELNDSSELQSYSSAVLYALSAVAPPPEYVDIIVDCLVQSIRKSESWRIRLHALPTLVVFFYRSLMTLSPTSVANIMDILLLCLSDENIEVREMAAQSLAGVLRCSQRQNIEPLKKRFTDVARRTKLTKRTDPSYATTLRELHSAILGLCALVESIPYTIEPWLPPIIETLADHSTDPAPISTAIRKCASAFKKTHQDTWHTDQLLFNEDQLQSLSSMLVGTSYYA